MKKKFLWMLAGSFITIFIILSFNFLTSYEKNVDRMLRIVVSYKGESLYTDLSSDIIDYITDADKTQIYFGKLPAQEAIEINAPNRATLYVFPLDEDSVIIRYEPRNGIKRTYKKSGYADFNSVLKAFYELTDNEVFNEIIEYQ